MKLIYVVHWDANHQVVCTRVRFFNVSYRDGVPRRVASSLFDTYLSSRLCASIGTFKLFWERDVTAPNVCCGASVFDCVSWNLFDTCSLFDYGPWWNGMHPKLQLTDASIDRDVRLFVLAASAFIASYTSRVWSLCCRLINSSHFQFSHVVVTRKRTVLGKWRQLRQTTDFKMVANFVGFERIQVVC